MFEQHTVDEDQSVLRASLQTNGYLLLRGALPVAPLAKLHREFCEATQAAGWTVQDGDIDRAPVADDTRACASPEHGYLDVYHDLYKSPELHAHTTSSVLTAIASSLLEAEVFAHPRLVGRLVFPRRPDFVTPPHQDFFQVRGTPRALTFWVPLHDCPLKSGPLRVAQGSHRDGLRPVRPAPGASGATIVGADALDWVTGEFRRGDVLVFSSMTVHAGTPNVSSLFRFSFDVRFQRISEPVSQLSLDFNERSKLNWPAVYDTWQDTSRAFYWRSLDLQIEGFDEGVLADRDRQAFELAERGDRASISTLQRIAAYGVDPRSRAHAERLLEGLGAPIG